MFIVDKIESPKIGLTGFEGALAEEELAIQSSAHRFAKEVMRPIAEKLDKMTPDEVVAEGSPLWDYLEQIKTSGLLDVEAMSSLSNAEKSRILPLIFEELGWGDSGLTLLSMVLNFPSYVAYASGESELIERFGNKLGCWLGTQPDRGSDAVDFGGADLLHPGTKQNRGNLHATFDGNDVIINGQSSAWVSGAPIAECALAYASCDYGDGIYKEDGSHHYIALLIPFDLDGISKGKPLDKLGQRSLPQGEIYFDNVRVPKRYVVGEKEQAETQLFGAVTFGNMEMSLIFTGVARAAYEHALAYAHERNQGGVAIIEHQSVRLRLFKLWQQLEAARAMARRIANFNFSDNGPHLAASATSKVHCTQACFDITNEALQLFGGNGLTKEYPIEKLLRDARTSLIEDGENNVLSMKAMSMLSRTYQENN